MLPSSVFSSAYAAMMMSSAAPHSLQEMLDRKVAQILAIRLLYLRQVRTSKTTEKNDNFGLGGDKKKFNHERDYSTEHNERLITPSDKYHERKMIRNRL
jgi:hypothetical protein